MIKLDAGFDFASIIDTLDCYCDTYQQPKYQVTGHDSSGGYNYFVCPHCITWAKKRLVEQGFRNRITVRKAFYD